MGWVEKGNTIWFTLPCKCSIAWKNRVLSVLEDFKAEAMLLLVSVRDAGEESI